MYLLLEHMIQDSLECIFLLFLCRAVQQRSGRVGEERRRELAFMSAKY